MVLRVKPRAASQQRPIHASSQPTTKPTTALQLPGDLPQNLRNLIREIPSTYEYRENIIHRNRDENGKRSGRPCEYWIEHNGKEVKLVVRFYDNVGTLKEGRAAGALVATGGPLIEPMLLARPPGRPKCLYTPWRGMTDPMYESSKGTIRKIQASRTTVPTSISASPEPASTQRRHTMSPIVRRSDQSNAQVDRLALAKRPRSSLVKQPYTAVDWDKSSDEESDDEGDVMFQEAPEIPMSTSTAPITKITSQTQRAIPESLTTAALMTGAQVKAEIQGLLLDWSVVKSNCEGCSLPFKSPDGNRFGPLKVSIHIADMDDMKGSPDTGFEELNDTNNSGAPLASTTLITKGIYPTFAGLINIIDEDIAYLIARSHRSRQSTEGENSGQDVVSFRHRGKSKKNRSGDAESIAVIVTFRML